MKKMNYKLMALALVAFAFTSCEEDGLSSLGEIEAAMGELYVEAEGTASQLFKNVDEAMRKLEAGDALPYTIDNASFDEDASNPGTYYLDYGTGTNTRGKVVKGKVMMTIANLQTGYLTPGASITASFDNYFEDDKPVLGSMNVLNQSDATNVIFDQNITGLTIEDNTSTEDGGPKAFVLNSTKTLTWLAGAATTNDITDDVYTMADGANGGTSATYDNSQYTFAINFTSPLKVDNTCQYRVTEGVVALNISTTINPSPITFTDAGLDFIATDGADDGNGGKDGCDKFFKISLSNANGANIEVTRQFNGF